MPKHPAQMLQYGVTSLRESFGSLGWDRVTTRLGASLLVVSALFFAANFADKAWVSYQVGQAKQQRMATIASANADIANLKQQLEFLHSRTYYTEAARRFGFVQPGDIQLELNQVGNPAPPVVEHPAAAVAAHVKKHESLLRRLLQAVVPGL